MGTSTHPAIVCCVCVVFVVPHTPLLPRRVLQVPHRASYGLPWASFHRFPRDDEMLLPCAAPGIHSSRRHACTRPNAHTWHICTASCGSHGSAVGASTAERRWNHPERRVVDLHIPASCLGGVRSPAPVAPFQLGVQINLGAHHGQQPALEQRKCGQAGRQGMTNQWANPCTTNALLLQPTQVHGIAVIIKLFPSQQRKW